MILGLNHQAPPEEALQEFIMIKQEKEKGFSEFVQESVLYHHENYDGSGYPENLSGI